MERLGLRSIGITVLLSLPLFMLLNLQFAFGWTSSISSESLSVAGTIEASSAAYGMGDLEQSRGGDEMRRRQMLQVATTPAPAPAPAAASSGVYIGYGVLTAGYVPCPPQTGRSYYTADCESATGPVQPYTRGCSTITLCSRG